MNEIYISLEQKILDTVLFYMDEVGIKETKEALEKLPTLVDTILKDREKEESLIKQYYVSISKYFEDVIEAETEDEAIDKALKIFEEKRTEIFIEKEEEV